MDVDETAFPTETTFFFALSPSPQEGQVAAGVEEEVAVFVGADVGGGAGGAKVAINIIKDGRQRGGLVDGLGGGGVEMQVAGGGIDEPVGLGAGQIAGQGAGSAVPKLNSAVGQVVGQFAVAGREAVFDGPGKDVVEEDGIMENLVIARIVDGDADVAGGAAGREVDKVVADEAALVVVGRFAIAGIAVGGAEAKGDGPVAVDEDVALDDGVEGVAPEENGRTGELADGSPDAAKNVVADSPAGSGQNVNAVGVPAWGAVGVFEEGTFDGAVVGVGAGRAGGGDFDNLFAGIEEVEVVEATVLGALLALNLNVVVVGVPDGQVGDEEVVGVSDQKAVGDVAIVGVGHAFAPDGDAVTIAGLAAEGDIGQAAVKDEGVVEGVIAGGDEDGRVGGEVVDGVLEGSDGDDGAGCGRQGRAVGGEGRPFSESWAGRPDRGGNQAEEQGQFYEDSD